MRSDVSRLVRYRFGVCAYTTCCNRPIVYTGRPLLCEMSAWPIIMWFIYFNHYFTIQTRFRNGTEVYVRWQCSVVLFASSKLNDREVNPDKSELTRKKNYDKAITQVVNRKQIFHRHAKTIWYFFDLRVNFASYGDSKEKKYFTDEYCRVWREKFV